jgi:hypothetical protein
MSQASVKGPSRKQYTIETKLKLLKEVGDGGEKCFQEVASKYSIPTSTLKKWYYSKSKILNSSNAVGCSPRDKRITHPRYPKVDDALLSWFLEERSQEQPNPVSMMLAVKKANDFARECRVNLIKGQPLTQHYVRLWASRNGIKFTTSHGEAASAPQASVQTWLTKTLPQLLKDFKMENIFNCDETGLLFKAFYPKKTFCFKNETATSVKVPKDRVSILLCASAVGEKRKPLVIGKSRRPRRFPANPFHLPFVYRSSPNAWMTVSLFREFVRNFEMFARGARRKICLLWDRCSASNEKQKKVFICDR